MIASGDPINFILASLWTVILLFCILFAWYAYIRWKRNPDQSLSHYIALWLYSHKERLLVGFILGLIVGITFGFVIGMFTGHWFWPVVLEVQ
jgi:hypothetical protein